MDGQNSEAMGAWDMAEQDPGLVILIEVPPVPAARRAHEMGYPRSDPEPTILQLRRALPVNDFKI